LHEVIERRNQQVAIARRLSASIGIAVWTPKDPKSLAMLHRIADDALYDDQRARRASRAQDRESVTPSDPLPFLTN